MPRPRRTALGAIRGQRRSLRATSRSTTGTGGGGSGPNVPTDITAGAAATEIVLWMGADKAFAMTNAQKDAAVAKGIKAIVVMQQDFQGRTWGTAAGDYWDGFASPGWTVAQVQTWTAACTARGIRTFLGFYWVNRTNSTNYCAPIYDWDADATWDTATQSGGDLYEGFEAAQRFGFIGCAFDPEEYAHGGGNPTWGWDYVGYTNEATSRADAYTQGVKVGTALQTAFPGCEYISYENIGAIRHGWQEDVVLPTSIGASFGTLYAGLWGSYIVGFNFWDGILSVAGYPKVTLLEPTYYRGTNISGGTYRAGFQYDNESKMAWASTGMTSWQTFADKICNVPFFWPDDGLSTGEGPALSAAVVSDMLTNAHQLCRERIALYGHHLGYYDAADLVLNSTTYNSSFTAFNTAETVDTNAPTISAPVVSGRSGANITIAFNAAHGNSGVDRIAYTAYAANGTTVLSSGFFGMTFSRNGGTYSTNFNPSIQQVSQQLAVPISGWVLITAKTPQGQTHSVAKQVTI